MTLFTAFGLTREPFGPEPDAELFYPALGHEDALERLRLTVALGLGLGIVTGETGYGKTTVRAALLDEIAHHPGLTIAVIDDPTACRTDVLFLRRIMAQIGLAGLGRTGLDLTTALLRDLAVRRAAGEHVLLAIDDAHGLASNQLDVLRTLIAAGSPAPLTVLLFGEPDLTEKVARKRNLAQRAAMTHALNPLNRRDTAGLIAHRLAVAGSATSREIITTEAVDEIHVATDGVPARIVALVAAAMDEAVAAGMETVGDDLARRVIGTRAGIDDSPRSAASLDRSAPTVIQTSFTAQLERLATPATGADDQTDRRPEVAR
jgi:type II secretory pathway predicted ATPase ExeA